MTLLILFILINRQITTYSYKNTKSDLFFNPYNYKYNNKLGKKTHFPDVLLLITHGNPYLHALS